MNGFDMLGAESDDDYVISTVLIFGGLLLGVLIIGPGIVKLIGRWA